MEDRQIKEFYKSYSEAITQKRRGSKYPLRAYVHEMQYQSVLANVFPGMKVLDAGCGDGTLSFMMAEKGANVIGVDISEANIIASKKRADKERLSIEFMVGDVENLPFSDNSFDLVVSSHVLEHIPDFNKGLREVLRVSKKGAVVAIPTIGNPCSWVQVGGGWFYLKGLRSFLALPYGFLLMCLAYISGKEGVDEGYIGKGLPHIFRFVKTMKKRIKNSNLKLVSYEASSIALPYFTSLLPIIKFFDKYKNKKGLRNLGYGTTFIIEK